MNAYNNISNQFDNGKEYMEIIFLLDILI